MYSPSRSPLPPPLREVSRRGERKGRLGYGWVHTRVTFVKYAQCKATVIEFFFMYKKIKICQARQLFKKERNIVVINSFGTRQMCVPILALFLPFCADSSKLCNLSGSLCLCFSLWIEDLLCRGNSPELIVRSCIQRVNSASPIWSLAILLLKITVINKK